MDAANLPTHLPALVAGLAFALAFVFGAVANRVNFCTMGAVVDISMFGDWRRMRMWVLAIAVATAGTGVLVAFGLIDTAKTIYTAPQVRWLSSLAGGLLFGFGMTLASGCGSKSLIRAGAGNLKSVVVVLVLGISASNLPNRDGDGSTDCAMVLALNRSTSKSGARNRPSAPIQNRTRRTVRKGKRWVLERASTQVSTKATTT